MSRFDNIGIRQVLALLVALPVAVSMALSAFVLRQANAQRSEAEDELASVAEFVALRDLESVLALELAFHTSLHEESPVPAVEVDKAEVAMTSLLAAALVAGTDDAMARGVIVLRNQDQAAEFDQAILDLDLLRSLPSAAEAGMAERLITALESFVASLSARADALLVGSDSNWDLLDRQSSFLIAQGQEFTSLGWIVSGRLLTPDDIYEMSAYAAVADAAFDDMVDSSKPEDAQRLIALRDSSELDLLRQIPLSGEAPEPMNEVTVLGHMNSFAALAEEVGSIRNRSMETVVETAVKKRDAANRTLLFVIVAISTMLGVAVAGTLVVGGRLVRRLGSVALAAKQLSNGVLGAQAMLSEGADEIAVVATALNEVSVTMARSSAQLSALAEQDFSAPVLQHSLPGRLGDTMNATIGRLREASSELAYLAQHDKLTGLFDRNGLDRQLAELTSGDVEAVLVVDLDDFKEINDTYGHAAGDAVLVATARRISARTRSSDIVSRTGGDEFVVVLRNEGASAHLSCLVRDLRDLLAEPIRWQSKLLEVRASVGFSMSVDGDDIEVAFHRADAQMYEDKRRRRGQPAALSPQGDFPGTARYECGDVSPEPLVREAS